MVCRAAVVRICGCEGAAVWLVCPFAWDWDAFSEYSALSSVVLRTLFGRLPRGAGDDAPVDTGLLSPTRLLIRDSISFRLSPRPGVGDMSYRVRRLCQCPASPVDVVEGENVLHWDRLY
jgi:hypothetical protein